MRATLRFCDRTEQHESKHICLLMAVVEDVRLVEVRGVHVGLGRAGDTVVHAGTCV